MSLVKRFYADRCDCLVYDSRVAMGAAAADLAERIILDLLGKQEEVNLMLSIGQSQFTMFDVLFAKATIDWRRINILHVDEKLTLEAENPLSGQARLKHFIDRLPYKAAYFFDGVAEDAAKECERYAKVIEEHPIDIVFLGIGDDGHLAFCEPGHAKFDDAEVCKVFPLDEKTKLQNLRGGGYARIEDVPGEGYTITLPALMAAKYKIVCSPFKEKAQAAYNVIFQPVSETYPASIMRMHENVYAFFDPDSAALFPDMAWKVTKS